MIKSFFLGMLGVMFLSGATLGMQRFGVQGLQAVLPKVSAIAATPVIIQAVNKFSSTSKLYKAWSHHQKPEEILGITSQQPDIKEVYSCFIKTIKNCDPKDTDKLFRAQEALNFFEKKYKHPSCYEQIDTQDNSNSIHSGEGCIPTDIAQIIKNGAFINISLMGRDQWGWINDTHTLRAFEAGYYELVKKLHLNPNDVEKARQEFLQKYPTFDSKLADHYFFQQQSLRNYYESVEEKARSNVLSISMFFALASIITFFPDLIGIPKNNC